MRAALGLFAVTTFIVAGCASGPPSVPPSPRQPTPVASPTSTFVTATVPPGTCPDVSTANNATDGVIYLGPFGPEETGRLPTKEPVRKLYVGSLRPGHDEAVLVATDPSGRTTRQRRPKPEPQPGQDVQFFPGELETPIAGAYRLELTIGPNSMCVVVTYA